MRWVRCIAWFGVLPKRQAWADPMRLSSIRVLGVCVMLENLRGQFARSLALVGGTVLSVGSALAEVPEEAEAVFTGLAADAATVLGYSFVAMAAITGGWIVFRMVKSGAKRAAS